MVLEFGKSTKKWGCVHKSLKKQQYKIQQNYMTNYYKNKKKQSRRNRLEATYALLGFLVVVGLSFIAG